jgi:hypothetical protein
MVTDHACQPRYLVFMLSSVCGSRGVAFIFSPFTSKEVANEKTSVPASPPDTKKERMFFLLDWHGFAEDGILNVLRRRVMYAGVSGRSLSR